MDVQKIFKWAELFEKKAVEEEAPPTDPMIEGEEEELAPPTLRDYPGEEPPAQLEEVPKEGVTEQGMTQEELERQIAVPINITINQDQLDYILRYLKRNVQRDRATLEKRYRGKVPSYEAHRVKHLDAIDTIVIHIEKAKEAAKGPREVITNPAVETIPEEAAPETVKVP